MGSEGRKFSISVRIEHLTPAHVTVGVFSAMVLVEYDHTQVTRGKSGTLTMRCEELQPFLKQLDPHIISRLDSIASDKLEQLTGARADVDGIREQVESARTRRINRHRKEKRNEHESD